MKELFIASLRQLPDLSEVELLGWVVTKRDHGNVVFLDIADSTGSIQVVFERNKLPNSEFSLAESLTPESAIRVHGILQSATGRVAREVTAKRLFLIGSAPLELSPHPHQPGLDILDHGMQEHLLDNRFLYLRNPKIAAMMRFRHHVMGIIHNWFRERRFIEITAPILTPTPLYEDRSAMGLEIHGQHVFLTQCVGFYLESAVHALERVYNIGPSFRGEESRSKRHLMEYWHVKAEIAFADFEDIVSFVERFITEIVLRVRDVCQEDATIIGVDICPERISMPFPRIGYGEAVAMLQTRGFDIEYGKSMGSDEEAELSKLFQGPFWITGIPRTIEPFPYVIDARDPRVTMTADLIASRGFGELLGVAEKIHTLDMLDERLKEKGKSGNPDYEWLRQMRQLGCVPHVGFGMGVERFLRWLLGVEHVRDTIPFFRTFGRRVAP